MGDELEQLVAAVLNSSKYAKIAPGLIARIGAAELGKGRRFKDAVKATKNKLHQVGGAYFTTTLNYDSWLDELKQAPDTESLKQTCWMVMGKHASTRERLPFLKEFYPKIFSYIPPPETVLDAACGLNPLSIPWMPLTPGTRYLACDIYADMVAFVGDFIKMLPIDGQTEVCDVIASPPDTAVDLAMVLKTIPCLEQVDKNAGTRLLDGLNTRYLVLSFPAKSLGGRSKGMVGNYQARFEELAEGRDWKVLARLEFATELVFVVDTLHEKAAEDDFDRLIRFAEKTLSLLQKSSDPTLSVFSTGEVCSEFEIYLDELRIHHYANVPRMKVLLAPTGAIGEIAVENGWGMEYLHLAHGIDVLLKNSAIGPGDS